MTVADVERRLMWEALTGGRALARAVADRVLHGGQLSATTPTGAPLPGGHDLRRGGSLSQRESEQALSDLVGTYLATHPDGIALFESALAAPTDPFLSRSGLHHVSYGEDVLFVVRPADVAGDLVLRTLRDSRVLQLRGVLCGRGAATVPADGAALDPGDLAAILRNVDVVLVGAYDGEAELVWTREPAPRS